MKIRALLTRKFGPLPAAAWLGIFTVAVLVYRHFRPGTPAVATDTTAAATDLGAGGFGFGAGAGGGSGALAPPDTNQADLGGNGTPVIYDPLTNGYGDTATYGDVPPYFGGDQFLPADPGPNTTDSGRPRNRPNPPDTAGTNKVSGPGAGRGKILTVYKLNNGGIVTTYQDGHQVEKVPGKPAYVIKAANRPDTSTGRQVPRKANAHAPAPVAPKHQIVPKAVVVQRAPPLVKVKPRKPVLRPAAQQAHNHGAPAPVRARSAPVAAPVRRTQSATAAPSAAPARAAAPVAAPVLQPGAIPQPGKAYAQ